MSPANFQTMNALLASLPATSTPRYTPTTPDWVRTAARLIFLLLGSITLIATVNAWGLMGLWPRVLVIVTVPLMFLGAFHRGVWGAGEPAFVADNQGMYFRPGIGIGHDEAAMWLFVPWHRMSNFRVSRIRGELAKGAAMDVTAAPEEFTVFFNQFDRPADKAAAAAGDTGVVFYDNAAPSARTVIRTLLALKPAPHGAAAA